MFKFKSRFEIAQDVADSYDNEELFSRFNKYCDEGNDVDDMIYYNDSEFLEAFSKDEIADYASYKYRSTDTYVRMTIYGFESDNYLRNLIDDGYIHDMNRDFLRHDDVELQIAYADYLETLAADDSISIQDWIENIIFYHDNDDEKKYYGIDSSALVLEALTLYFSDIYNRSSEKQIQHAKEITEKRTDIFPENFIEENL